MTEHKKIVNSLRLTLEVAKIAHRSQAPDAASIIEEMFGVDVDSTDGLRQVEGLIKALEYAIECVE